MCGIAGKVYLDGEQPVSSELIQGMMDLIAYRGPDGQGKYVCGPVGLGHRRLAIIDVNSGSQPMCNEDESVWIVFNGEIYNFPELREGLIKRGHLFRSATDTEVIVHLYEDHGVDCLRFLRGMFAFAIWDARQRVLFLARDRVGIKPLYYSQTKDALLFGSEIKSLFVDPDFRREVDLECIDRFLTYLYLPGTSTLFKGVRKLEPGHYLLMKDGHTTNHQYWDLGFSSGEQWRSIDQAADALNELLSNTVKDHMISDVPVGFLASGGVDSTALLSYAVKETGKRVQTFTVGFDGEHFADERPFARMAAQRFGTEHHEITISAQDFAAFLPGYVWHMEEPVCEPPGIALYYVAKLAQAHVKVLLSGEGGDEAFGGYPSYRNFAAFERCKALAGPFRGLASAILNGASRFSELQRFKKYAALEGLSLSDYYYSRLTTPNDHFNRSKRRLYSDAFAQRIDISRSADFSRKLFAVVQNQTHLNQMLYVDTKSSLPDDLLIKADKMTMAASVELRVPFLDHKVLEFAAGLPSEFKVKGSVTKRVLKRAFRDRVPSEILSRKKAGFPVPFARWLHGEMAGFVYETLLSAKALSRGYFRPNEIEGLLARARKDGSLGQEVFALLNLELWHRQFVDTTGPLSGAVEAGKCSTVG